MEIVFQYLPLLFHAALIFLVLSISALFYFQNCELARAMRPFSHLRLHFIDILGHLRISITHRFGLSKSLHTYHVYELQSLCGYMYLCRHYGFTLLWLLWKPVILIFKADSAKLVLNNSVQIRKAWFYYVLHPWLGFGLLTSEGEKWKQRRRLLTPTFHFEILKNFLAGINNQSKVLVKVLQKKINEDWIDFAPYMARCSLDIICETTMGVKVNSQVRQDLQYLQAVNEISEYSFHRMMTPWLWSDWLFSLTPTGRKAQKSLKIVHGFTRKVIAERKEEMLRNKNVASESEDDSIYSGRKKKAFLDFLLEEHLQNSSLTEEDIREEVDTFTFEGHDTTAFGMTWATYLLGLYPEIQEKVHDELDGIFGDDKERDVTVEDLKDMKYLDRVLKESQRLYPSVPVFGREINENFEFHGHRIPKGASCMIFPYMLHRDPEAFPNPEVFDPDRFLPENSEGRDAFAYIPFSAGPRNCIGQKFAVMEEKVVLATMLRHFNVRSLDSRDKVQVVSDLILRPRYPIRIQIQPRE